MKLLFLNGPNLNMLGIREPGIYGRQTYQDLEKYIRDFCGELGIACEILQSNHEGAILDAIHAADGVYDAIIINPAAYTHTSVALLDALKAVSLPAVEVHLSDVSAREDFRQISYVRLACRRTFAGHGFQGYRMAAEALLAEKNGASEGEKE